MNEEHSHMALSSISHSALMSQHSIQQAAVAFEEVALEMKRPFFLVKPKMYLDGNAWCALYGENIQEGVCGFGDSPSEAAEAFDICWLGADN